VTDHQEANFGIIVAAGRGKRFGGLKQFSIIKRRPLIFYSARIFEQCRLVNGFVIVTNPSRINFVKRLVRRYRFKKLIAVVPGGKERMDSVEQGLLYLPDDGYVAIHDGVRPMLSTDMLILGFTVCRRYQAVAFGIPVTDTIKEVVNGDRIIRTVDRSGLVAIQTPQFFSINLIRRGYAYARAERISATDDCELIEKLDITPHLLPGSRLNIKVTTKEDSLICQALL